MVRAELQEPQVFAFFTISSEPVTNGPASRRLGLRRIVLTYGTADQRRELIVRKADVQAVGTDMKRLARWRAIGMSIIHEGKAAKLYARTPEEEGGHWVEVPILPPSSPPDA